MSDNDTRVRLALRLARNALVALLGGIATAALAYSVLPRPETDATRREASSLRHRETCQVLFVGASRRSELGILTRELNNRPTLTIGESHADRDEVAMIELVKVGTRLQFEIDIGALENSRLRASSQLLRLAARVSGAP